MPKDPIPLQVEPKSILRKPRLPISALKTLSVISFVLMHAGVVLAENTHFRIVADYMILWDGHDEFGNTVVFAGEQMDDPNLSATDWPGLGPSDVANTAADNGLTDGSANGRNACSTSITEKNREILRFDETVQKWVFAFHNWIIRLPQECLTLWTKAKQISIHEGRIPDGENAVDPSIQFAEISEPPTISLPGVVAQPEISPSVDQKTGVGIPFDYVIQGAFTLAFIGVVSYLIREWYNDWCLERVRGFQRQKARRGQKASTSKPQIKEGSNYGDNEWVEVLSEESTTLAVTNAGHQIVAERTSRYHQTPKTAALKSGDSHVPSISHRGVPIVIPDGYRGMFRYTPRGEIDVHPRVLTDEERALVMDHLEALKADDPQLFSQLAREGHIDLQTLMEFGQTPPEGEVGLYVEDRDSFIAGLRLAQDEREHVSSVEEGDDGLEEAEDDDSEDEYDEADGPTMKGGSVADDSPSNDPRIFEKEIQHTEQEFPEWDIGSGSGLPALDPDHLSEEELGED